MEGRLEKNGHIILYIIHGKPFEFRIHLFGCRRVVIYSRKADTVFLSTANAYRLLIRLWGIRKGIRKLLYKSLHINFIRNGAYSMEYQKLFGGNLRMKVFDKAGSDLYLSTGVFGEWERWNWSGVKQTIPTPPPSRVERRMLRWNQYVKYARKASEYLDISLISYLQFPLSGGFLRPRWYVDANAYLKATRKLSVVFHWDHVVDWNTPVPIDRIYYGFSTGVQVAW